MFQTTVVEKIKTHFYVSVLFRSRVVLVKMCNQDGKRRQATNDNTVRGMSFAFWITKVTHAHSEHVMLPAFTLLKWFHESTSMLSLHISCLFL
jgi:hypothetical protein